MESPLPITQSEIPLLNLGVTMRLSYLSKSDLTGRKRFAFIDSRQVLDFAGVHQKFWSADKHPDPVIVPDNPREQLRGYWTASGDDETTGCGAPQGLTYDGSKFRIWYNGMPGPLESLPHIAVAYAESSDGINWHKPHLRLVKDLNGSLDNNLTNLMQSNVSVIDLGVDTEPSKRFRAMGVGAYVGPTKEHGVYKEHWPVDQQGRNIHGVYHLHSTDGLNWEYYKDIPGNFSQDSALMVFDSPRNQFIGSLKFEIRQRSYDRRSHALLTSKDGFEWGSPRVTLCADEKDDEMALNRGFIWSDFQNIGMFPTRDVIIGFLEVSNYTEGLYRGKPHGQRLGFYGKIETQLMYSYDGFYWHRSEGRLPLIPWGEEGSWDEGGAWRAKTAVEVDDEVHIYYEGFRGDHSNAYDRRIGLAKMRRDRWASFSTGKEGMLEVYHGIVEGDEMTVNARAINGSVRIEVLQGSDSLDPVLGFDKGNCLPFVGDEIQGPVRWKNKSFKELKGKQDIVFRFHIESADLFAYEVF